MEEPKTQKIGPTELQYGELRVGYMDKVDFDYEIGNAKGGNRIFPSIKDLKENKPCIKECGIVEVEVRLRQVVQETDFSERIEKAQKRKKKK